MSTMNINLHEEKEMNGRQMEFYWMILTVACMTPFFVVNAEEVVDIKDGHPTRALG